jgi:hypothetical protein
MAVPAAQPGVCEGCRGPSVGSRFCDFCSTETTVLPIALLVAEGGAYDLCEHSGAVVELVEDYLRLHSKCLGGSFDRVAVEPENGDSFAREIALRIPAFTGRRNVLERVGSALVASDVAGSRVLLLSDSTRNYSLPALRLLQRCRASHVVPIAVLNILEPPSDAVNSGSGFPWLRSRCGASPCQN